MLSDPSAAPVLSRQVCILVNVLAGGFDIYSALTVVPTEQKEAPTSSAVKVAGPVNETGKSEQTRPSRRSAPLRWQTLGFYPPTRPVGRIQFHPLNRTSPLYHCAFKRNFHGAPTATPTVKKKATDAAAVAVEVAAGDEESREQSRSARRSVPCSRGTSVCRTSAST